MNNFERDLEQGLHGLFDPYLAERPEPWRARARGRTPARVAGGIGGALVAKLATGAVIAALAAGAGIEAVNTHSLNPVDWGRAVSRQVQNAQPGRPVTPAAHVAASPTPNRQTPAPTPVASPPAVSPPAVSPPAVSPLPLPTVSPIPIPTIKPTILPTIP
jgi:hypothetical protein